MIKPPHPCILLTSRTYRNLENQSILSLGEQFLQSTLIPSRPGIVSEIIHSGLLKAHGRGQQHIGAVSILEPWHSPNPDSGTQPHPLSSLFSDQVLGAHDTPPNIAWIGFEECLEESRMWKVPSLIYLGHQGIRSSEDMPLLLGKQGQVEPVEFLEVPAALPLMNTQSVSRCPTDTFPLDSVSAPPEGVHHAFQLFTEGYRE